MQKTSSMLHRKQAIHEEINQDPSELAIVGKGAAMVDRGWVKLI